MKEKELNKIHRSTFLLLLSGCYQRLESYSVIKKRSWSRKIRKGFFCCDHIKSLNLWDFIPTINLKLRSGEWTSKVLHIWKTNCGSKIMSKLCIFWKLCSGEHNLLGFLMKLRAGMCCSSQAIAVSSNWLMYVEYFRCLIISKNLIYVICICKS